LYKKKKQSLKKIKRKNKSKRNTFRKNKKINLARKSLKNLKKIGGGAPDEIRFVDKILNGVSPNLVSSNYILGGNGNLMTSSVQGSPIPVVQGQVVNEKPFASNTQPFITGQVANGVPVTTGLPVANSSHIVGQVINSLSSNLPVTNGLPVDNFQLAKNIVDEIYKQMHEGEQQDSVEANKGAFNVLAKIPKEEEEPSSQSQSQSQSQLSLTYPQSYPQSSSQLSQSSSQLSQSPSQLSQSPSQERFY